jgi:hypothetical protein
MTCTLCYRRLAWIARARARDREISIDRYRDVDCCTYTCSNSKSDIHACARSRSIAISNRFAKVRDRGSSEHRGACQGTCVSGAYEYDDQNRSTPAAPGIKTFFIAIAFNRRMHKHRRVERDFMSTAKMCKTGRCQSHRTPRTTRPATDRALTLRGSWSGKTHSRGVPTRGLCIAHPSAKPCT